jgi:type II secretory pathway component PulF
MKTSSARAQNDRAAASGAQPRVSVAWWRWLLSGVGDKQRVSYYRQLATLLDAGVPIQKAVQLAGRALGWGGRGIAKDTEQTVASGSPLHEALERYRYALPDWHLQMIRAAEESGTLPAILMELAGYVEERIRMRRALLQELIYPSVVFLAFCFIPPFPDLFLGRISVAQYLWAAFQPILYVALVVGTVYGVLKLEIASPAFRYAVQTVLNSVPVLGPALVRLAGARFALILRALYVAGLPLHQALLAAGRSCGNEVLNRGAAEAARFVREGRPLVEALARTRAFPAHLLAAVEVGEESGRLDDVLDRLQKAYAADARHALRILARVFTLLLYLAVVALVAWKVLRFWMDYVDMVRGLTP